MTQFYPSIQFQQDVRIFKKYPTLLKEPTQRQEMTLSRLAQVCSLAEDVTHKLLQTISKSIVSRRAPN